MLSKFLGWLQGPSTCESRCPECNIKIKIQYKARFMSNKWWRGKNWGTNWHHLQCSTEQERFTTTRGMLARTMGYVSEKLPRATIKHRRCAVCKGEGWGIWGCISKSTFLETSGGLSFSHNPRKRRNSTVFGCYSYWVSELQTIIMQCSV